MRWYVDTNDITPFRLSKPFEEHMPEVLDSLASDPNGLYQVTYRVGSLMVSAQVWRDAEWGNPAEASFSDADEKFLKSLHVILGESPEEHATP